MGRKGKITLLFLFIIFLGMSLFGCKNTPNHEQVGIYISGPTEVKVGETITLNVNVLGSELDPVWASSDETIATVENGVVSGVTAGSVNIKVSVGDDFKEYSVTVKNKVVNPISNIEIIISGPTTIRVGSNVTLEVSIDGSELDPVWTSSDETIATVENGVVSGIAKGEVTIRVSVGEAFKDYNIVVSDTNSSDASLFCGVSIITNNPSTHNLVEMSLLERELGYIKKTYNPFDYNKIYVYGVFTSPTNQVIMAPAFWYRDYTIVLNTSLSTGKVKEGEPDGLEMVNWASDDYEYRLRFQPHEAGTWKYIIYTSIDGIITDSFDGVINVSANNKEYKGLIKVDESNNRTFVYEDGTTFMPIGENMAWWADNSRKTYDYYVWFSNANKNNMNICRIWLAPWGFCLHWGKSMYDLTDRLNYAARLDKVFEYAEQFDMNIMLCLLNHGQFSTTADSTWSENPYNVKNGGILDKPEKFFNTKAAKENYKNELLYIIGRYGYSDKIFCWELFNEVDWTDNADLNAVTIKAWHKEMANFVKNNDSYGHMVSTSYKTEYGASFTLDEIDFACPHSYGYAGKNICDTLPNTLDKLYSSYNKPILHAEIGIDWQNGANNYRLDPTGVSLRQASWAGMMGGGAGGAMNWWWDSYVHPYDLYYQFAGAGKYAKLLDLTGSDYTQLRTLSGVSKSDGIGLLGYRFNNRIYGYVYDVAWRYNTTVSKLENKTLAIPFTNGTYKLTFYHATNGSVIGTTDLVVSDGVARINLLDFTADIAFIVK